MSLRRVNRPSVCLSKKRRDLLSPSSLSLLLSPFHPSAWGVSTGTPSAQELIGRGDLWRSRARKNYFPSQFERCPGLSNYLIILRGIFPNERHLKMHRGYKALG